MCIAVPGTVTRVEKGFVLVSYPNLIEQKALSANLPIVLGDKVMVQMGIVVKVLTPAEAKSASVAWEQVTTKL